MAGSCCEGLWMEWVVACMAQAKPDWTLFTQRAPGVPSVPPRGSRVTARARTFTLVLLFLPSVNLVVQRAVFSETLILMAGPGGGVIYTSSLLTHWLIDWLHISKVLSWRSFPHVIQTHTQQHIWSKDSRVRAEMLYRHQLCHRCRSPQHLHQLHTLSSGRIQSHILNQSGSAATGSVWMQQGPAERYATFHE